MDYIISQFDKKLRFLEDAAENYELANLYRVKIEYGLLFIAGYLWNKNLGRADVDNREIILSKIIQPTIGSIVEISRILDVDCEIFGIKALNKVLNKYPQIRNEKIGHGFVFQDGLKDLVEAFSEISEVMFSTPETLLGMECELIHVQKKINGKYLGINFKPSGSEYVLWRCPEECGLFEIESTYCCLANDYFKLSPFIEIQSNEQFFVFRDVQDRLTGKVRYNRLFQTGVAVHEWPNLISPTADGDMRVRALNGTIINTFSPNYRKYIDIGIKKQLIDFLLNNRSSVCATVWGHGGVGKTATVQAICEELGNRTVRAFDYVIFASAKDRYYDFYTGSIKSVAEKTIDSFESLIRCINGTIGSDSSNSTDLIFNFEGKILIVIDDLETFSDIDKQKIEDFLKKLDISKHKVLITTRANIVIGLEYETNELQPDGTIDFLLQVLASEFVDFNLAQAQKQLEQPVIRKLVQDVTSGRPLFIFQLALIWAQKGTIQDALKRNIKEEKTAIDFLYGRIFDYLSENARKLFVAISQLVSKNDPSNLLEKLQFITSLDDDDEGFQKALKELLKLRLIEIHENRFFRVYSNEILQIMVAYFGKCSDHLKGGITGRILQVTRDKNLDNERALLESANSARFSKSEEETLSQFRQVLNRTSSPLGVKLVALLNLADYLFNHRGKKESAVEVINEYRHLFPGEPALAKVHANYLWALHRQDEAIGTLSEFFARKPKLGGDYQKRIELTGLYVTYASISVVERKEEIKTMKRYGEINLSEFNQKNDETRRDMARIFGIGWKLYVDVKDEKMSELSPASRQNVSTALVQLVNVALRLNKFDETIEICEFGLKFTSGLYPGTFRGKLEYAIRMNTKNELFV